MTPASVRPAERIARFLAERARAEGAGRARGATASEIAAAVLALAGLPGRGAEGVVRGLIGNDPRFRCDDGLWSLAEPAPPGGAEREALEPAWVAESAPVWDPADDAQAGETRARRRRAGASAASGGEDAAAPAGASPHAARLLPAAVRRRLPSAPGIYVFRARNGRPLYVGKAKDLRRRILSHFRGAAALREEPLHAASGCVTFEVAGSEGEALLREFELIARHAPKYNLQRAVGARRVPRGGCIAILPAKVSGRVRLFGLREEGPIVVREVDRTRRLAAACEAYALRYLRAARPRAARAAERRETERALSVILRGWLARNRDRLALVDPRRAADPADLARLLRAQIADADLFRHPSRHV